MTQNVEQINNHNVLSLSPRCLLGQLAGEVLPPSRKNDQQKFELEEKLMPELGHDP